VPPDPPVPLYASVVSPGAIYRVYFDKPLQPRALTAASWEVTHQNLDRNPYSVSSTGYRVSLATADDVTFNPPNGISYDASPPELYGTNGYPVAPFVKVPFL